MSSTPSRIILFRPISSENYRQGEVPIQLLSIARMLLEDYEVKIICTEVGLEKKKTAQVKEEIRQHLGQCSLFCVTAMTGYGLREALAVSRFVREESPDTPIVWGGWHASLCPEQTLREADIDFVVVGQGEMTMTELAEAVRRGETDFSSIQGLGWKDAGRLVINPPRPIFNINDLPLLPFHLIEDEFFGQRSEERTGAFVTSIGCPLDCGFCADRAVYGGKWNRLSAERTLEELKGLRDTYGVKAVRILDSNFFVHWPRGLEILRGMRDLGMRAIWVNARIPRLLKATDEDLQLFKDTVDYFLVGAESGSEETLQMVTKLQTVDDIRRLAKIYGEWGISICFSTLVGLPYEDRTMWEKEFSLTLDLIDDVLREGDFVHTAQMHLYTPYPGTPLYKDAIAQGFEPPECLEDWADVELFTPKLPYLPPHLGERVEFITTYVLQLLRPRYQFYRGKNPLAKAGFAMTQMVLRTLFRLRWKTKYFAFPLEMHLIRRVLSHG